MENRRALIDERELVGVAPAQRAKARFSAPAVRSLVIPPDQLEQEADDRSLDLADLGLLAKLAGQEASG